MQISHNVYVYEESEKGVSAFQADLQELVANVKKEHKILGHPQITVTPIFISRDQTDIRYDVIIVYQPKKTK